MLYRVSNVAERQVIEKEFGFSFKYPNLYKPSETLNGVDEVSLSIITMDEPNVISFGIWGILPEKYDGEWCDFQRITNTLILDENLIASELWHSLSLGKRRCVIIVTGFYTSLLVDGSLTLYKIFKKSKKPFLLAGLYNQQPDGFITCSILTVRSNKFIEEVYNLSREMPLTLSSNDAKEWLDSAISSTKIKRIIKSVEDTDFISEAINDLP